MSNEMLNNNLNMLMNTIANAYCDIVIYGRCSLAEDIYNYLKETQGVCVQIITTIERKEIIVDEKVELVINLIDEDLAFLYEDGRECYSLNYNHIVNYEFSDPSVDIYNNIAVKLKNDGVNVVFIKSPNLHQYKPKIPLFISMGIFSYIVNRLTNRDSIRLRHLRHSYLREDFIQTKADGLKGYTRVHGNGQYINYDDGFRRIPVKDATSNDAAKIYVFGYCISANPMIRDDETICALLQEYVGKDYKVLSRSNSQTGINYIMRERAYRTGDWVFVFTSYHDSEPEKQGFTTINLTDDYCKTTKLWRHITDSSFHIDNVLAQVIAKRMSEIISNNSDDCRKNDIKEIIFGSQRKRAPEIHMYNDDGLVSYLSKIIKDLPKHVRGGAERRYSNELQPVY